MKLLTYMEHMRHWLLFVRKYSDCVSFLSWFFYIKYVARRFPISKERLIEIAKLLKRLFLLNLKYVTMKNNPSVYDKVFILLDCSRQPYRNKYIFFSKHFFKIIIVDIMVKGVPCFAITLKCNDNTSHTKSRYKC